MRKKDVRPRESVTTRNGIRVTFDVRKVSTDLLRQVSKQSLRRG